MVLSIFLVKNTLVLPSMSEHNETQISFNYTDAGYCIRIAKPDELR